MLMSNELLTFVLALNTDDPNTVWFCTLETSGTGPSPKAGSPTLACALWDPDTREKATKLSGRLWLARMMFSRIDSLRAFAAARLTVSCRGSGRSMTAHAPTVAASMLAANATRRDADTDSPLNRLNATNSLRSLPDRSSPSDKHTGVPSA